MEGLAGGLRSGVLRSGSAGVVVLALALGLGLMFGCFGAGLVGSIDSLRRGWRVGVEVPFIGGGGGGGGGEDAD